MQLVKRVSVRPTKPDELHIEAFDNTKLTAINTCPVWGIIRYGMHKRMSGSGRAIPLEAGAACHEVFAAIRVLDLWKHQGFESLAQFHGRRLFGEDRFSAMCDSFRPGDDERTQGVNFALTALHTSGFYDDPNDKRRTLSNLEEACIAYFDRWSFGHWPIWVRDKSDPRSDVGIEIPFDMLITFNMVDGSEIKARFTGKVDGIHLHRDGWNIHENKTASRLDDAWRESFRMSHQITGYTIAMSVHTVQDIGYATVLGTAIPQPRHAEFGGNVRESVSRPDYMKERWFNWFLETVIMYQRYKDDILNAPQYTHSCNRYFRSCSLIPFCSADQEEQVTILSELEHDEWSPLHNENQGEQM